MGRSFDEGNAVSYDLSLTGKGPLNLTLARQVLGGDNQSDEGAWNRSSLTASILFTPDEIGVGVVGDEVPAADRGRDF